MDCVSLRGLAIPLGKTVPLVSGLCEHVEPTAFDEMLRMQYPVSLVLGDHNGLPIASTDGGTLTLFAGDDGLYFSADVLADVQGFQSFAYELANDGFPLCSVNFGVEREYEVEADGTERVTSAILDHICLAQGDAAYGGHTACWNASREPKPASRLQWYAQRWEMAWRNHLAAKASAPPPTPRAPCSRSMQRPALFSSSLGMSYQEIIRQANAATESLQRKRRK